VVSGALVLIVTSYAPLGKTGTPNHVLIIPPVGTIPDVIAVVPKYTVKVLVAVQPVP
jgi:hypothetical protein